MGDKNWDFEFPATNQISFFKLFDALEEMQNDADSHSAQYAKSLLADLNNYPELKSGFTDETLIETKYKEPIQKLSKLIFPDILQNNEIKGVSGPFNFAPFLKSKRLTTILENAGPEYVFQLDNFEPDLMYKVGCTFILTAALGFPADISRPFILDIPDKKTNQVRYYRIAFNADLMEILPTEKAPKITSEDYQRLIQNFDDIDLWKEKFPPNSYVMRGIGIMNLMDITYDHSVSLVTSNLLSKDLDSFEKIKTNIKSIMGIPNLKVGFVGLESNQFCKPHSQDMDSFLLHELESDLCENLLCEGGLDTVLNKQSPLIITDTDNYAELAKSKLGVNLMQLNIGSYLLVPIKHNNSIIACLELASPKKMELNSVSIAKLDDLLPIISVAAGRFREEAINKIEALIQQECTTIHPSVKWRFEQEAIKYMNAESSGNHPEFNDIVFRDIYPLYGQMDIKGSSQKRNQAVINDLIKQLSLVKNVLEKASDIKPMPMFDELSFRINNHIESLNDGLMAGSEHEVMAFLKKEIYPVFDHVRTLDKELDLLVNEYDEQLDPNLGILYDERKKFDQSVTRANHMMASFIDYKQSQAQEMFPHYFERYKTDGLEYNIYIGQSIVNDTNFDPIFLKNLRLWQLVTMCQLENEFMKMRDTLETRLEVASLILVYNTPLAIHFRMDEKRFDVEGAYNARYEIVKKRVDKAHIKDTNERITQPGKIAIIYTNEQDKVEYLKYIQFMESKGYLQKNSTEDLYLEELQGITGLKALRVTLSYSKDVPQNDGFSYDQLLESLN